MRASEVINTLQQRGVELWREGDALRYRAPAGTFTEQERTALKAHKSTILRALATSTPPVPGDTHSNFITSEESNKEMKIDAANKWESYEERAAIMEFDGGLSRAQAEQKSATCRYCRHWCGTKSGIFAYPLEKGD